MKPKNTKSGLINNDQANGGLKSKQPTEGKGIKEVIIELVNSGLTYREVAEKVGIRSTNTINYHVKRLGGKKIYLSELERDVLKRIILDLRTVKDDSDTHRITNSILDRL